MGHCALFLHCTGVDLICYLDDAIFDAVSGREALHLAHHLLPGAVGLAHSGLWSPGPPIDRSLRDRRQPAAARSPPLGPLLLAVLPRRPGGRRLGVDRRPHGLVGRGEQLGLLPLPPGRGSGVAAARFRCGGHAYRPLGSMGSVVASQSYDLGPGPGIGWPGVRDVAGVNPRRLVADCLYGSSGYLERSCRCDMIAVRFGCTACASGGSNPAPRGPYALFSARRGVIPRRLKRVDAPGELRFRPPS